MEFSPQPAEKPEQISWSTDGQADVGHVRSHTCAFCKRGFSNAQALGGHMNIHRRNRAKLMQQFSEENLLFLDISVKNSSDHHEAQPSSDKNTNNHKKLNIFPNNINGHESQRGKILGAAEIQLPFLAGRSIAGNNEMMKVKSVMVERIEEKKKIMASKHACSSKVELDLELRLGPKPLQDSPPLSTREFF